MAIPGFIYRLLFGSPSDDLYDAPPERDPWEDDWDISSSSSYDDEDAAWDDYCDDNYYDDFVLYNHDDDDYD